MKDKRKKSKRRRRGQREVAKVQQEIAITEQLQRDQGLTFESEPYARYVAGGGLPRMITMLVRRHKMKAKGEWVPPLPWAMFILTAGVLAAFFLVVALFSWLQGL